jgi:MerR family transcriptional regulator, copper efflux regulator
MRIGELAKNAGVDVPTIRYYETLGLLPRAARSPSGYRQYGPADLERLNFVKHNQKLGFTLREIGMLTRLHTVVTQLASPATSTSLELQSIVAMLEAKREDVDAKITYLKTLRQAVLNALNLLRSQPVAICPASAPRK